MSFVSLLFTLLVLALVVAVAWWVIGMVPMPPQIKQIVSVIFGLMVLVYLLGLLFGGLSLPTLRLTG